MPRTKRDTSKEYFFAAGDFEIWQMQELKTLTRGKQDFVFWLKNGVYTATKPGMQEPSFLGMSWGALTLFLLDYYNVIQKT